jgi:hypothetical protein
MPNKAKIYAAQKKRWKNRKTYCISIMGGKCQKCGYNKCEAALEFHHLDPKTKEMNFSKMRLVSHIKMIEELKKCILLCANCHRETHNPENNGEILTEFSVNNETKSGKLVSSGKCLHCLSPVYNTKFCSVNCHRMHIRKAIPSKEELYPLLLSMTFVDIGKKYGVTDNAVRKWAKAYGLPFRKKDIKGG